MFFFLGSVGTRGNRECGFHIYCCRKIGACKFIRAQDFLHFADHNSIWNPKLQLWFQWTSFSSYLLTEYHHFVPVLVRMKIQTMNHKNRILQNYENFFFEKANQRNCIVDAFGLPLFTEWLNRRETLKSIILGSADFKSVEGKASTCADHRGGIVYQPAKKWCFPAPGIYPHHADIRTFPLVWARKQWGKVRISAGAMLLQCVCGSVAYLCFSTFFYFSYFFWTASKLRFFRSIKR